MPIASGAMARQFYPLDGGTANQNTLEPWSGRVCAAPAYTGFAAFNESIPQPLLRGDAKTYEESAFSTPAGNQGFNKAYEQCWPLVSGLLNTAHMLPLHIVNAGIVLELTLANPREVGIWRNCTGEGATAVEVHTAGTSPVYTLGTYSISEVAYVAHIVQLSDEFNNALRNQVNATGSLTLHGDRYQHFGSSYSNGDNDVTINIPARSRSIKAIFSMQRDAYTGGANTGAASATAKGQTVVAARDSTASCFLTSSFAQCGVSSYYYSVGSVQFPTQPITMSNEGRVQFDQPIAPAAQGRGTAQPFCELLKCFGTLGSIDHATSLSKVSYSMTGYTNPGPGDFMKAFVIGYSLDSFSRSVIESGVNSSDRALQISLHLNRSELVAEARKDRLMYQDGFGNAGKNDADETNVDGALFSSVTGSFLVNPAPVRIRVDSYVVSDQFFFFNSNGSVTATI